MKGSKSRPTDGPPWTAHVDSLYESDLQGLLDAADAVEQLQAHPGWEPLMRLLETEADQVMGTADGRLLESRSEYAFAHGRVGGLRSIKAAAGTILARAALRLEQQRVKHEGAAESVPGGRT